MSLANISDQFYATFIDTIQLSFQEDFKDFVVRDEIKNQTAYRPMSLKERLVFVSKLNPISLNDQAKIPKLFDAKRLKEILQTYVKFLNNYHPFYKDVVEKALQAPADERRTAYENLMKNFLATLTNRDFRESYYHLIDTVVEQHYQFRNFLSKLGGEWKSIFPSIDIIHMPQPRYKYELREIDRMAFHHIIRVCAFTDHFLPIYMRVLEMRYLESDIQSVNRQGWLEPPSNDKGNLFESPKPRFPKYY